MKYTKTYKTKWYEFTPEWSGFNLKYHIAGYDDPRPMLQIYIIWGKLFLYLPWYHYKKVEIEKNLKQKRKDKLKILSNSKDKIKPKPIYKSLYYDTEPPIYGIYFHMNQFVICYGEKTKFFDLPWAWDWIRTSFLKKDNTWEHETKHNRKDFWNEKKWKNLLFEESYPYTYITKNGTVQNVISTIKVVEREWRWKWFKWFKYIKRINKVIDIEFNKEVGEESGSWKGGVVGCSYTMLKKETPYQTLKRMEKERKF